MASMSDERRKAHARGAPQVPAPGRPPSPPPRWAPATSAWPPPAGRCRCAIPTASAASPGARPCCCLPEGASRWPPSPRAALPGRRARRRACRRWCARRSTRSAASAASSQGRRGRHQAERRLRQEPRPGRHHPARHARRRVKLCLGAGARKVIVADNPINNPESCFFKTGSARRPSRAGAELMMPQDSYFEPLYVGGETITDTGGCSTARSARRPRSSASRR